MNRIEQDETPYAEYQRVYHVIFEALFDLDEPSFEVNEKRVIRTTRRVFEALSPR